MLEISEGGVTCSFRVIPEQPAISRASLVIRVITEAAGSLSSLGFLRMSASKARVFLADLSNDRSPIIAKGDEDGDVHLEYKSTDGPVLMVRKPGEQAALHCWIIGGKSDMKTIADELLADLGA